MKAKKLNPNARKWVRALRSGKYKQTKDALCTVENGERSYCCLGVACELYAASNPLTIKDGELEGKNVVIFGRASVVPPKKVIKWLGLQSECGDFDGDALTSLNDGGTPFAEIADIIESQPGGLFV